MKRRLLTAILALWLSVASFSQEIASGVPESVRAAVSKAMGTHDSTLVLETLGNPQLPPMQPVEAVEIVQDHNTGDILAKLQCVPHGSCLPFYVLVHATLSRSWTATNNKPRSAPLVRAGDLGRLERSSSSMRITLPAVALEAGRSGDLIRVRTGRQVWRARVISRGVFESVGDQK